MAVKQQSSKSKQMKFYIQDCQTAEFMRCDSTWSADIDEALDFLSERRAFFFGMKELKNSFQILEIATEALLPIIIPQLALRRIPHAVPARAEKRIYEQVLPMRRLQSSIPGLCATPSACQEMV
jgi:hypothetical protein